MKQIEKCHFIGIGGIGMSGLARILLQRKHVVSGSDLNTTTITQNLAKMGATIHQGHSDQQIPSQSTVIVSTDIKSDNPEYQAAQQLKLPVLHRSDLLAVLMEGYKALAVTGTHGKTTTSSLLVWVFHVAGLDPSFAVGGWIPGLNTNAESGKGEYFIVEADESDGTFLKYRPLGGIITNIDHDHMNYFGTENKLVTAFGKFAKRVANSQHLFWCGEDSLTRKLSPSGVSYGFSAENALRASSVRQEGWSTTFDAHWLDRDYNDIQVALTGEHNVLNALAVFGLALSLGVPEESIRTALKSFPGVQRRCERRGERGGVLVIDDYAHHPTEIVSTLKGIRGSVQDRRVIAVFQPHRYSRTKHCMGQYKHVFDDADELIITDIYASNEPPLPKVSAQAILEEVQQHSSIPIRYVPRNSLRSTLVAIARPHDVIVTLGAGDVTALSHELAEHFADQSPKRWTVGLVCGGMSVEHEVSCISAKQMLPQLSQNYYEVKLFGVTKEGRWIYGNDALEKLEAASKTPSDGQRVQPLSQDVLVQLNTCDVIVPLVHGTNGEDGTMQGFFDVLGKAYVGGSHRACAICMDKVATKQIAQVSNVPIVPFLTFSAHEWRRNAQGIQGQIQEQFAWPIYLKPRHLGSSIQIHRVSSSEELVKAVTSILEYDTHFIAEPTMVGREIEFNVIGNDSVEVFHPGEIFSNGELHTYAGKYSNKPTPDTSRADLPEAVVEQGKRYAAAAYKAVGCTGLARVDFFLDASSHYWLNEINPMPGMTPNSMFPRVCEANGLALPELMHRLIILAMARRRSVQRLKV